MLNIVSFTDLAKEVTSEAVIRSVFTEEVLATSDTDDLSVDDIQMEGVKDSCKKKCLELAKRWKRLDKEYLTSDAASSGNKMSTTVNLPQGLKTAVDFNGLTDLKYNSALKDPTQKQRYVDELVRIFREMPHLGAAESRLLDSSSSSLATVKLFASTQEHVAARDDKRVKSIHPGQITALAAAGVPVEERRVPIREAPVNTTAEEVDGEGEGKNENDEEVREGNGGIVPSGTCILNVMVVEPSTEKRVLEVALLSTNTLLDLRNCLYLTCGQDEQVFTLPDDDDNSSSTPSMRDAYFYIEGIFYAYSETGGALGAVVGSLPQWLVEQATRCYEEEGCGEVEEDAEEVAAMPLESSSATVGEHSRKKRKKKTKKKTKKKQRNSVVDAFGLSTSASRGLSAPPVRSMADTTLAQLRMGLGRRYVLCHGLGRCQHWLYFTDTHIHHPAVDARLQRSYPFIIYKRKQLIRTCEACQTMGATRVTYGDRFGLPSFSGGGSFFCEQCYHMLHYDQDNMLLYDDFAVFPYTKEPRLERGKERD